jgi:hypothetical protein
MAASYVVSGADQPVDKRVRDIATGLGFTKLWLWDVDSLDWKHLGNSQAIINEVEGGLARSRAQVADILFHDKMTTVEPSQPGP